MKAGAPPQTGVRERRWTAAQEEAVNWRGGNLLVAAAAGTGKTAVLVERVKARVLAAPGTDVDRLLVVTFTEAAAAEIRERLAQAFLQALTEEPDNAHLRRQLALLPQAPISTLHSFCLSLLRRYFPLLGLDPAFRVLGEEEALLLQMETAAPLIRAAYAGRAGELLAALTESYGGERGEAALTQLLLRLYRFSRSHPDPEGWLARTAAAFSPEAGEAVAHLPWTAALVEALRLELAGAAACLAEAAALVAGVGAADGWAQALEAARAEIKRLRAGLAAARWDAWQQELAGFAFPRLPARRREGADAQAAWARETARRARDEAREVVRRLQEDYAGRTTQAYGAELGRVAPFVQALVKLAVRFGRAYQRVKEKRGLVDFADLEHHTLRLLSLDPAAGGPRAVLARQFVEVLVDEYQDINAVQEAILVAIAPERRFLVGDAKQSIYRFRLAEPRLFLEKYAAYRAGRGGRCLHLSTNFRSRRSVLAGVNFLFRQLMHPEVVELDYPEEAWLVYGAAYPKNAAEAPIEVYFLEARGEEADEREAPAREAELVARRLRVMLEGTAERPGAEFSVWEEGKEVPVSYRHVAVLLRATHGRADFFLEALEREGIPAVAELSGGFFASAEVRTMLALLRVIDNPRQDIPLAAVLASPIVGLGPAELARVRLCRRDACFYDALVAAGRERGLGELAARIEAFLARLENWRTLARSRPLPELIWHLLQDTGFDAYLARLPRGERRRANLRALVERAARLEALGRRDLSSFLAFLASLEEHGADPAVTPSGGFAEEAVRVMSVHKAKGLEFPVVVVADLGRPFNFAELAGDLLLHRDLGLGPVLWEREWGYKYPTLAYQAIRARAHQESLAEEMRLLYVALTRARERLLLVGSAHDLAQRAAVWSRAARRQGWLLGPNWLLAARSWLDWLGPALGRHAAGAPLREAGGYMGPPGDDAVAADPSSWEIHLGWPSWLGRGAQAAEAGEVVPQQPPPEPPGAAEEEAFVYPWAQATRLAAKMTVSELRQAAGEGGEDEFPGRPLWRCRLERRPAFLGGAAGAERTAAGLATHLVLQHLELDGPLDEEDIRCQIAGLVARRIMSTEQAELVDVPALAFF
ncbi:MAG: helicase-exonuclease AddAB subunit AddA, partial [Clostridia bacterium]|nr:helicase-exonuclease AddAB subunit AddA [Clostridia bacterium]